MADRRALSKSTRFEVFKRDEFTCQYCGQHPPAVVLEIDHVVAVSDGGSDEEHNLVAACRDCNRGKAARPLGAASIDVAAKAQLLRERMEQTAAYEALLNEDRARAEQAVDRIVAVYEGAFQDWTLLDKTRPSIRRFLKSLPEPIVIEAMELACARMNENKAWRYFCGVCWHKIRDAEGQS